jgi:hypothetical protein
MDGKFESHMERHGENRPGIIKYDARWDVYYIVVSGDGENETRQDVKFCPWCGERLPASRFSDWHKRLEELGLDWRKDAIPEYYNGDRWWRSES